MPYIVSYNEMLKGFHKLGEYTASDQLRRSAAIHALHSLLQRDAQGVTQVGRVYCVRPANEGDHGRKENAQANITTYNLRMAALCAKDRNFKAGELLDAMLANNVTPNSETYTMLLETLKSRKLKHAKELDMLTNAGKGDANEE